MPGYNPPGIMPLPPRVPRPPGERPGVPPGGPREPRAPSPELPPWAPPPPSPPNAPGDFSPPSYTTSSNWDYGMELPGGQSQAYWASHPDEYMAWILSKVAPNATYAYKQWILEQARRQYDLWDAYRQRYGQVEDYDERPLGDWLASFVTGKNMPWSETAVGNYAGEGSAASQAQAFYRNIARFLGHSGSQAARDWRESANATQNPYRALEIMMAGTGYSPSVRASVMGNAPDLRSMYGGLGQGEGVPNTYAEWLWRMYPRRG